MIIPIRFENNSYFKEEIINNQNLHEVRHYDIAPDKDPSGDNQDVWHLACSQMNNFNRQWSLQEKFVNFKDVLAGNFDTEQYLEITIGNWYLLKDRSWAKDKNIIVTNFTESWLRGLPCFGHNLDNTVFDLTVLEDLKLTKNPILVRDNAIKIDDIKCVQVHYFYMECREHHQKWIPWCKNYEEFVADNINRIDEKQHKYVALLGHTKPHRTDFQRKIQKQTKKNSLSVKGFIGGFDYGKIDYDEHQTGHVSENFLKDRYIAKQWLWNTKLWVIHETHCTYEGQEPEYMCAPITEKTWKPIAFGMPFVINCNIKQLERLEDLGFDTFRSVFGDYHTNNYESTNDNIIEIIKNIDSYDSKEIKRICRKNWIRFMNLTEFDFQDIFWKELGISYT